MERAEQRSSRQALGQEMISTSNEEMSNRFDQLFPRRPLRLDLLIDKDTDKSVLLDEFRNTIHNHALELKLQDIRISAAQPGILEHLTEVAEKVLEGEFVDPDIFAGGSEIIPTPYPAALRAYVERLTGVTAYASTKAIQEDATFLYTHAKMSVLHARAKAIYACFEKEAPPIPPRLLRFEPEYIQLFDEQEQIEILRDRMAIEVVERLTQSGLSARNNIDGQQINATLVLSTLFAGSYAIEEKHPGISPFDATRLLLENVDQLGAASHPKLSGALYMHTITPDEPARGTFPEMVRMATGSEKMTLDSNNRLHLPLPDWSRGMCPLSYSYRVDPGQGARFEGFNEKIATTYDVDLPSAPKDELVLASQFFVYAVLLGETLVNGRAHECIQSFRGSLPGRIATSLQVSLEGKENR